MNIYYTGIGSRETPDWVLKQFTSLAHKLEQYNIILRSGGADGADSAFEKGVVNNSNKIIYLPKNGFNKKYDNNTNSYFNCQKLSKEIQNQSCEIANKFHFYFNNLNWYAKELIKRDAYQVLGHDLSTPSLFVVCWTKNGKEIGGTSQAIRIAKYYNIPIINFGIYKDLNSLQKEKWNIFEQILSYITEGRKIIK